MSTLDLAIIGNGTTAALVEADGTVVWLCLPAFDGDPVFCALLGDGPERLERGVCAIELMDVARTEQAYETNTPILVTRLTDHSGGSIEITDVMPRFRSFGRTFCPAMLVRRVRRVAGNPRMRVRVRPAEHYGRGAARATSGSHHIRYQCGEIVLRLTTDVSISAVLEERAFFLDDAITLVLGPDETLTDSPGQVGRRFLEETSASWRDWVRHLSIPFEWQDAVIRAAITLELNACEDTGAIVAAITTSIPEAAGSRRTWDYRYCWLRDGYFVVDALNQLGATRTMERYLAYLLNVVATHGDGALQPLYGINGRAMLEEMEVSSLPGYRGMGPVRVGNAAYVQRQHDTYGAAILAVTHVFFDQRLNRGDDTAVFERLEALGARAAALFDQPDAGIWELRGRAAVHTFSSAMCWAGCDRLARIATRIGRAERAAHWRAEADRIARFIDERMWNPALNSFAATVGGHTVDASLLHLHDIGFLSSSDPRLASTVDAIGRHLMRDGLVYRYLEADDFGEPENAFLVCTFWYIEALAALGRRDEARALFERVLALRNRHGLLAEHIDPRTGEQWGNFVQTYSMVGIIRCAIRLSTPWDEAF